MSETVKHKPAKAWRGKIWRYRLVARNAEMQEGNPGGLFEIGLSQMTELNPREVKEVVISMENPRGTIYEAKLDQSQ
jgi:hypothetical protein